MELSVNIRKSIAYAAVPGGSIRTISECQLLLISGFQCLFTWSLTPAQWVTVLSRGDKQYHGGSNLLYNFRCLSIQVACIGYLLPLFGKTDYNSQQCKNKLDSRFTTTLHF